MLAPPGKPERCWCARELISAWRRLRRIDGRFRQHHSSVFVTLPSRTQMTCRPVVEIGDVEVSDFRHAKPRAVHRRQHGPVFEVPWCFQQRLVFGLTQNDRQFLLMARQGDSINLDAPVQSVLVGGAEFLSRPSMDSASGQ